MTDYDNLIFSLEGLHEKKADPTDIVVKKLNQKVDTLENKIDTGFSSINEDLKKKLDEELSYEVDEQKIVESVLAKVEIPTPKNGEQGKKGDKGDKGDRGIAGKNGIDGLDGKDGLAGKNGLPGADGSPDTAVQIKEKLETLKKNERLDVSAIKGIEKLHTDTLNRAVSILDQRTKFLINKQSGASDPIYSTDVEITDSTKGLIIKSSDGTRWRLGVNDAGMLTTTSL